MGIREGKDGAVMTVDTDPRRILVKLVSTALSGFFYTTTRPRVAEKLAMMKYDPKGGYDGPARLLQPIIRRSGKGGMRRSHNNIDLAVFGV